MTNNNHEEEIAQEDGFKSARRPKNHPLHDALVGLAVGVSDVACLYPLVCLASRLESGAPLKHALAQGKLYSGAMSALKLLVPYCVVVETVTNALASKSESNNKLLAAPFSSLVVSLGLQPLEKQMTMEQLLQTRQHGMTGIVTYTRAHGLHAIMRGFSMLWLRETCYIAAVTSLNPYLAERHGAVAAFGVGFGAGMISAPFQTLNVLMKSEVHKSQRLVEIWKHEAIGPARLWKGSFPRSTRCGFAGVLWFVAFVSCYVFTFAAQINQKKLRYLSREWVPTSYS